MKGFRRAALPLSMLRRPGFEHVLELAVLVSLAGERIHEIPVTYVARSRGRSKMRHVPETLKFLGLIVGYWLRCVVLGRSLNRRRPGDADGIEHGGSRTGTGSGARRQTSTPR
jgi:hypothetical protein